MIRGSSDWITSLILEPKLFHVYLFSPTASLDIRSVHVGKFLGFIITSERELTGVDC
jgi:hypothetical protein